MIRFLSFVLYPGALSELKSYATDLLCKTIFSRKVVCDCNSYFFFKVPSVEKSVHLIHAVEINLFFYLNSDGLPIIRSSVPFSCPHLKLH